MEGKVNFLEATTQSVISFWSGLVIYQSLQTAETLNQLLQSNLVNMFIFISELLIFSEVLFRISRGATILDILLKSYEIIATKGYSDFERFEVFDEIEKPSRFPHSLGNPSTIYSWGKHKAHIYNFVLSTRSDLRIYEILTVGKKKPVFTERPSYQKRFVFAIAQVI